ncbi:MAG: hypothetical protein GON13_00310 [Nanoarchaeota archaeon]|nr:hypothetical protein [Nanoarchaeota archaeon]
MNERLLVEQQYNLIRKEWALPLLRDVESNLNTRILNPPVIKNLILVTADMLQGALNHLFSVLEPNNTVDIIESNFYTEKQKKDVANKYNELMSQFHELMAALHSNEKEQIKFFKKSLEIIPQTKNYMKKFNTYHANKWRKPRVKSNHSHIG